MAVSGSMFLTEVVVSELRSCVKCKDFLIKSQFADLFSVILKESKDLENTSHVKKKTKRKTKVRKNSKPLSKSEYKTQSGQSILFTNDIANLITNMKLYPMELSLWSKAYPKYKIASTNVPWSAKFIEYLEEICIGTRPQPVSITGEYNVFDEVTSRRMAVIKLNMKLSYLTDKITTQLKSLAEETPQNLENILTKVQDEKLYAAEETGIIRTLYSGGKKNIRKSKTKKPKSSANPHLTKEKTVENEIIKNNSFHIINESLENRNINSSIISLVKSTTDIDKDREIDLLKCKSCSSMNQEHLKILNYIFGDPAGTFGNQVYCVNYFTIDDTKSDSPSPKSTTKTSVKSDLSTTKESEKNDTSEKSSTKNFYKLKLCDNECPQNDDIGSLDIPIENAAEIEVIKCKDVNCKHKEFRKLPPPPDDRILLDLASLKNICCDKSEKVDTIEKVEEVFGGMIAKMKFGDDPCYCECQCKFGFTKKTKYCKVCGGYETIGEDEVVDDPQLEFPCPIYHNLADKPKTKSSIISDPKKGGKAKSLADKSIESEKETKKGKKKKKDDKFKFNYGYTAPHIGHDYCAQPCAGTLGEVPKSMGWLWTAENVPGMKFRPSWKPGAVNKHVLRLLRMAKHPGEIFTKKKKKRDSGKVKRPLKRPLLIVHKKDGEFTVTMETMKAYSKPRTINQVPYEDKDALTYTIGRTEEENRQRRIKKERAQRRLERSQREFIQSAFHDMCQEICLKTYQQALGILPHAEDPDCTCYPADPGPDRTDLDHSCSCSEDSNLSFSDTDSDEWIVEFTPPTATFDPTYKCKKITTTENSSQYTYLDYRVKLLDRYGNPVPRFFKGPDGKEQCSDLGGFWSPDHKWLEINVDGFIGPDGKWAPHIFIGPDGENVDAEIGKFQANDGTWLVVGVDGYIDSTGKWRYYSKVGKRTPDKKRRSAVAKDKKGKSGTKKEVPVSTKKSETTWSCFGDANPSYLSKLGILGHGHDRKLLLDTLNSLIAQGEDVKIPTPSFIPRSKRKRTKVKHSSDLYDSDKTKCRHPIPSSKGVLAVDSYGNKIYFRLLDYKNKRPEQRILNLTSQGISLSSFHVPCFHSFINSELMKKQLYKRRAKLAEQHGYVPKPPRKSSPASDCSSKAKPRYRNAMVAQGWKPGAISKRLLRKLNKAKKSKLPVRKVKVAKKVKKNVEGKPTLIVCKMNGAYHIEMQVSSANSDTNIDQCSPLKYTIQNEDNEERIQKRLRKRQRLIKEAVNKVWSDPYHPDVCEKTCLKAYKQAVGLLPYDPNNPECTCSNDEESEDSISCFCEESDTSSEGGSLDLQWEIHFTPPSAHY
ncbi:unnamed protein product [Arctia plantaginis]|uniref:DUF4776 domain-containing protein n=1 Tax=Arctia plantaginis TaxID=874455 RepID=A0A8S1A401_ARCPL|nr:unnamed protein product [Arctia plantaginis]